MSAADITAEDAPKPAAPAAPANAPLPAHLLPIFTISKVLAK